MARGKQTCKILKEIRRRIAESNGIEFATSECRYRGDSLGTCPKCEAEGYDDPVTIKVKYPKRNTMKTIKFKHKKK